VFLDYTKRRDAHALGVFVFCLLAFALLLPAFGCESKDDPKPKLSLQYGDPVGIQIGAHGTVPALSVGVAVTKGRDPTPSIPSIATAIHAAALACPAFVSAISAGKIARVEFGARHGVFESLGAPVDDVGGACISAALGGKPVTTDKPDPLDIIVELRLDKGDASRP
jgi:hypothetical protein